MYLCSFDKPLLVFYFYNSLCHRCCYIIFTLERYAVKLQLSRRIIYLLALVATFFVMQVFFRIMFWTMVSNLPLSFDSHLM